MFQPQLGTSTPLSPDFDPNAMAHQRQPSIHLRVYAAAGPVGFVIGVQDERIRRWQGASRITAKMPPLTETSREHPEPGLLHDGVRWGK
jgi:hypothetical protein